MEPSESKPTPIRPAILSAAAPSAEAPPPARAPQHTPLRVPQLQQPLAETVGASDAPCPSCGYDLRGCPATTRCPECGAESTRALRMAVRDPVEWQARNELRQELARSWYTLGFLALAPIALLTPLPCLLPFGVAFSICFGFAPGFRLFALRPYARIPEPFARAVASDLAWVKRAQWTELVLVAAIACYAALATFAWVDATFTRIYFALVLCWWCVAAIGLATQLRLGRTLATECLTSMPPKKRESHVALAASRVPRALRSIAACLAVVLVGAVLIVSSFATAAASAKLSDASNVIGLVALALGAIGFAAVAIFARSYAELVAACVLNTDAMREPCIRDGPRESDDADEHGAPNREARNMIGRRASELPRDDDDTPIELA